MTSRTEPSIVVQHKQLENMGLDAFELSLRTSGSDCDWVIRKDGVSVEFRDWDDVQAFIPFFKEHKHLAVARIKQLEALVSVVSANASAEREWMRDVVWKHLHDTIMEQDARKHIRHYSLHYPGQGWAVTLHFREGEFAFRYGSFKELRENFGENLKSLMVNRG